MSDAVPAPAKPVPASVSPSDNPLRWLKENVEAVVVAYIMALVIRCFFLEVFKIPTSSMEPYLLGDFGANHRAVCPFPHYHSGNPNGDRIMVTKFFYALAPLERFDVSVFRFPLEQSRNFIKRVVGIGPEEFFLDGGDVYTAPAGTLDRKQFRIARKPLRTQQSIWIDVTEDPDFLDDADRFRDNWEPFDPSSRQASHEIQNGTLRTSGNDGRRDSRFTFTPRIGAHDQDVGDLRIVFDAQPLEGNGSLFATIANGHGTFTLTLRRSGEGTLALRRPGRDPEPYPVAAPAGEWNAPRRVELHVCDGVARALLDDTVAAEIVFLDAHRDPERGSSSPRISFGAENLLFTLSGLRVGRDIHYYQRPGDQEMTRTPLSIPEGAFLMMGDNVSDSHDGRAWRRRRFVVEGQAEPVDCEDKQMKSDGETCRDVQQRFGLPHPPQICIEADQYGNRWALYRGEAPAATVPGLLTGSLAEELRIEHFPFVESRFIVGKAFWIFWPPSRAFRMIR